MIRKLVFNIFLTITVAIFVLSLTAFASAIIIDQYHPKSIEQPVNSAIDSIIYRPGESRIKRESIQVYENAVVIEVYDAKVNQQDIRDPLVNKDSNIIQIVPSFPESIKEGDIVTYEINNKIKTNRIEISGNDQDGHYYRVQSEQEKIRFKDIKSVVIGILY
jgi:hypothetical protein